jgi:hypothetical protein
MHMHVGMSQDIHEAADLRPSTAAPPDLHRADLRGFNFTDDLVYRQQILVRLLPGLQCLLRFFWVLRCKNFLGLVVLDVNEVTCSLRAVKCGDTFRLGLNFREVLLALLSIQVEFCSGEIQHKRSESTYHGDKPCPCEFPPQIVRQARIRHSVGGGGQHVDEGGGQNHSSCEHLGDEERIPIRSQKPATSPAERYQDPHCTRHEYHCMRSPIPSGAVL